MAEEKICKGKKMELLEKLRQFRDSSYGCGDIADQLISLADLENTDELHDELVDALYYIYAVAQNPYNKDYFRVLYNVLLEIAAGGTTIPSTTPPSGGRKPPPRSLAIS